jgi:hypothetical protein
MRIGGRGEEEEEDGIGGGGDWRRRLVGQIGFTRLLYLG